MTTETTETTVKPTPTDIAATTIAEMLNGERTLQSDGLFDKMCRNFNEKKATLDRAKTDFEVTRDAIASYVSTFGYVPTGADKTTRYETGNFQASVVRAVGTEIDDSRVEEFQTVCRRSRLAPLFPRIFQRHVYYTLTSEAQKEIEAAKPAKKFAEAFFAVYALCFKPKPKSPALTITDLKAEAAKKAESEASRKAKASAKKAGKKAAA